MNRPGKMQPRHDNSVPGWGLVVPEAYRAVPAQPSNFIGRAGPDDPWARPAQ